jgi:ribosome-associated protein
MDEKIKNKDNSKQTDAKPNDEKQTDAKYIELNVFIKLQGLAATGGQAKILIRSGLILLNGISETRNKKKLYAGDIVEYEGKKYVVKV